MINKIKDYINLRNLIYVSIAIITIVALVILINKPPWFFQDLPEENFVKINLTRSYSDSCQACAELDHEVDITLQQYQASGLAFYSDSDITYILTADHFCTHHRPQYLLREGDIVDEFTALDHYGEIWNSQVIYSDFGNDLCLIASDMREITGVRVASEMPEIGEKVFVIAAPKGYSDEGMSLHFDGNFSGCDNEGKCYFVMNSYFGSSGGVILNSDGEIVSMIQMADIQLGFITIGPRVSAIRRFLDSASDELDLDLEY